MNRRILSLIVSIALIAIFGAVAWAAQGMVISAAKVPSAISAQIENARQTDPQTFDVIHRIIEDVPQIAAQSRNRRAMLTPLLRKSGSAALWPLLEYIAYKTPNRANFTDEQWIDTQCSILEAAGMIRDARALPVFVMVLADANQPTVVTRFAAEAVGRIGSDQAIQHLQSQLASAKGERRNAILTGMGQCRRAAVAKILAAELDRFPALQTRLALIESLRDVGNSWAWETPVIASSGEGLETRRIATVALMSSFSRVTAEEREEITKALQVVNYPDVIAMVEKARAKTSDQSLQAAYDRLIVRLENNPLLR